jgi:hypothetical protein
MFAEKCSKKLLRIIAMATDPMCEDEDSAGARLFMEVTLPDLLKQNAAGFRRLQVESEVRAKQQQQQAAGGQPHQQPVLQDGTHR